MRIIKKNICILWSPIRPPHFDAAPHHEETAVLGSYSPAGAGGKSDIAAHTSTSTSTSTTLALATAPAK